MREPCLATAKTFANSIADDDLSASDDFDWLLVNGDLELDAAGSVGNGVGTDNTIIYELFSR